MFFRRVALRGKLGFIKFNAECHSESDRFPLHQAAWNDAYREFYKSVDWALDIREAQFSTSVDFHFLPGRLVRRDPETQVLITRDRLRNIDWQKICREGSCPSHAIEIEWFLTRSVHDSCVVIAPRKTRQFERDLRGLHLLREKGIAEPD
jgi:hypothetical protein